MLNAWQGSKSQYAKFTRKLCVERNDKMHNSLQFILTDSIILKSCLLIQGETFKVFIEKNYKNKNIFSTARVRQRQPRHTNY